MPNWCENDFTFSGEPERVQAVNDLFLELKAKVKEKDQGYYPDFVHEGLADYYAELEKRRPEVANDLFSHGPYRYIFWPEVVDSSSIAVCQGYFSSKWAPAEQVFLQICEHFGVDGELDYREQGNCVAGTILYTASSREVIFVDLSMDEYDKLQETAGFPDDPDDDFGYEEASDRLGELVTNYIQERVADELGVSVDEVLERKD